LTAADGDRAPDAEEDWIRASAALALLQPAMGYSAATRAICVRAHGGMVRARAEQFVTGDRSGENIAIPRQFWWARGGEALTQNWQVGDFETWIDHKVHLQAFGVSFLRSDIEKMIPAAPPSETAGATAVKVAMELKSVFVGHGHSLLWRELKDFLKDDLRLPVEEFNSVPTAGVTTVGRLEELLGRCNFAFLVMTGEDEQADGKMRARENVVHEIGLFQGRLGFGRAIVLLEEGCVEFSNVHGLGHIPFSRGKISTCFEEIRRVLRREKVIA
jgi:predicted nucleotide-binding protein